MNHDAKPEPSCMLDFVVRSDAFTKSGGDFHQVQEYKHVLSRLGFDVRILEFRSTMQFRSGSVVHIVNIDRPYDFLAALSTARDHRVVVSPIHHDLEFVGKMRRAEKGQGVRSLVGRFLPESGREFLAFTVRSFRHVSSVQGFLRWVQDAARAVVQIPVVWSLVGRALDDVHAVTLLARGEGRSLQADTGWSGRNGALIPNGIPYREPSVGNIEWRQRSIPVVVVGRIEPRKRSVELAKAADDLGLDCVFIGPVTPSSPAYASEFASLSTCSPHVEWLGPLSHDEVQGILANSKVLVNASWVEVQSLVDIEAVTSGCWVITGPGGNSAEWMAGRLITVDTEDVFELLRAAKSILQANMAPSGELYNHTWESSANLLASLYR